MQRRALNGGKKEEGPSSEKTRSAGEVFDDGTNTFFWQAHTVLAGLVVACGLGYVTLIDGAFMGSTQENMRSGVVAVVVVFILIGVIHMPDGPFLRPHPVLWRLALVVNILYVLLLIFTLFQSVEDAREFMRVLDPSLGVPLPEKDYGGDCALYTPGHENGSFANFMDKMDVFVACHFFGWWVKALILRDVFLLSIISVGFELLEYSLSCQLPNFGECWWDHWVLDFAVCNGLGIWLGIKTCEYLEMKSYHWRGLYKTPTIRGKLRRAVTQFTPYSWTSYRWGYTESFTRFCFVVATVIFWELQELNSFYLKTILWVPPNHVFNFYREIIYVFCGACAMKEMYDYLGSSDKNARIGRFLWLCFAAIICETMIDIKFGWYILRVPLPQTAVVLWSCVLVIFSLWAFWKFTLPFKYQLLCNYNTGH
jgi:phosphatidylserine synthase 2